VSPKGFYEGLLLVVGKHVIQVNFPRSLSEKDFRSLKIGQGQSG